MNDLPYYRPNGQQWQVVEIGPQGQHYPGALYPSVEALLLEHPLAQLRVPEPVLPQDVKS